MRWWKSEKGYGRITADDGEVLFVHWADLVVDRSRRELFEGERVSFLWAGSRADHGRHVAEDVRLVGKDDAISLEQPVLKCEGENSIIVD